MGERLIPWQQWESEQLEEAKRLYVERLPVDWRQRFELKYPLMTSRDNYGMKGVRGGKWRKSGDASKA